MVYCLNGASRRVGSVGVNFSLKTHYYNYISTGWSDKERRGDSCRGCDTSSISKFII